MPKFLVKMSKFDLEVAEIEVVAADEEAALGVAVEKARDNPEIEWRVLERGRIEANNAEEVETE